MSPSTILLILSEVARLYCVQSSFNQPLEDAMETKIQEIEEAEVLDEAFADPELEGSQGPSQGPRSMVIMHHCC